MADHKKLSPGDLKIVRCALKTPLKKLINEDEKKFVSETKKRLERFGEALFLSEKQFAWLEKIANRAPARRLGSSVSSEQPDYQELAGE